MRRFLEEIALVAGKICLQGVDDNSSDSVSFKGNPRDLVTVVDKRVEDYLVERISKNFPDHDIVGEESGDRLTGSDFCWYIDPIDGTTSYFYRQPYFSVSIGLKEKGEPILGCVYAPALDQLFLAEKNCGAWLNNESIKVSGCTAMDSSVLATGFACLRAGVEPNNLKYLNHLLPKIRDVRRCGSAAIDMAYVAAGKMDGFWELNLNEYDIAAGTILVREAGGVVCDFDGDDVFPEKGIVAANRELADKIVAELGRTEL